MPWIIRSSSPLAHVQDLPERTRRLYITLGGDHIIDLPDELFVLFHAKASSTRTRSSLVWYPYISYITFFFLFFLPRCENEIVGTSRGPYNVPREKHPCRLHELLDGFVTISYASYRRHPRYYVHKNDECDVIKRVR